MPICPKDFKPCCDDLCHGGRCLLTGEETYEKCVGCGNFISDTDNTDCTCDRVDHDDQDLWGNE